MSASFFAAIFELYVGFVKIWLLVFLFPEPNKALSSYSSSSSKIGFDAYFTTGFLFGAIPETLPIISSILVDCLKLADFSTIGYETSGYFTNYGIGSVFCVITLDGGL